MRQHMQRNIRVLDKEGPEEQIGSEKDMNDEIHVWNGMFLSSASKKQVKKSFDPPQSAWKRFTVKDTKGVESIFKLFKIKHNF